MRKKKKWKKILIWVASIIIVLGVGGLFAANYAMDRMIAQLADSLESEIVADIGNTPDDSGDADIAPAVTDGEQGETVEPSDDGTKTDEEATKPASGSTTEEYSAEVSTGKAKDLQDKITASEKAKLASVFLKKLSVEDMKKIQELASGGLSSEEKKEARTLILEKLTPEEYDELIQIAKKYGMSQGKSYEEVSKEK
jgi:hypothetical protein